MEKETNSNQNKQDNQKLFVFEQENFELFSKSNEFFQDFDFGFEENWNELK